MLKGKRTIAFAAAAIMLITALAGCGGNQTTQVDKDGKFVPSKELELTVWETQGTDYAPPAQSSNDIVAKWLHEKTKVTIKNMYGNDGGQWGPKLTKLVAGDNLPDIVHCGAWQGPAHFAKLNQLGKVWELTPEIIQQYAPEVCKRTPAEYWEKIKVDGKILGIPYNAGFEREAFPDMDDDTYNFIVDNYKADETDVTYQSTQCFWIRDDVLKMFYPEAKTYNELCDMIDETGAPIGDELLDIPINSTQEFIDFMYKIKDANLMEDNKKIYPFGYGGGDNWIALTWLGADMYGYKNHSYTGTWNSVEQKIEVPLVHDVVRQAAKTQNKMINDKVIDPESLAHTSAQYKEKVLNGQYAIVPLSYIDMPHKINEELETSGKDFRYRPFITQVPAQEQYAAFKEKLLWTESLCILKTLSEDEMHQVLNWINTQYTDEFEQVRYWGPEEAGLYEETEDGKRVFKDEKFNQYFIEGDASALPEEEDRMGIGGTAGLMLVAPSRDYSKWAPQIMYRKVNYLPILGSGFKFSKDSEHVKNVKTYPPCQVWESVYADIPEVITFWSEREQWEAKFKIALATTEEQFDSKWEEAINELNRTVDIDAMEKAMTEVAKPLADAIEE